MRTFTCGTRYAFFVGKGGAGKSTVAAATALSLADAGKRVLLVGLDPASNLAEMLGVALDGTPTRVPGAHDFHALDLGANDVASFVSWMNGSRGSAYEHILFDTAPGGASALGLPLGWSRALGLAGAVPGHLAPRALTDPAQNTVVLVARPDAASVREAHDVARRLGELGLVRRQLVLNAVFHAHDPRDTHASAREARERVALDLPPGLRGIPRTEIPLEAFNMVGLTALRAVFGDGPPARTMTPAIPAPEGADDPSLEALGDALPTTASVVMVVGKGGVGKSAVSAAIARNLAGRGAKVNLATTEASLAGRIDLRDDPRLRITVGVATVDSFEPATLDLFADDRAASTRETVVVDGAPTGHMLQLVAAASAHHRALAMALPPDAASRLRSPLVRLRDPELTRVIVVTTAERTAVSEAEALQTALRRAGIEPFAWVVNATVARSRTQDPLLRQWLASELVQIARVRQLAERYAVVPWSP